MKRLHNGWRGLALIAFASVACWTLAEATPPGWTRAAIGLPIVVVMLLGAALLNGYAYGRDKRR